MNRFALPLAAFGVFLACSTAQAQSVGLFLNAPESFDGYTLVAPAGATRTHLIDNCGRIVNQWDSEFRTGESAYLLEDGSLLRTCRLPSDYFSAGGIGGRVEKFSWEGEMLWSFDIATDTAHHHHDIAPLPNGNVVFLCWEYISPEEAAAAGRLIEGQLWPPMLVEIEPDGAEGGNVVWEWHAWDHLIQDVDSALPNYGSPAEHPTRFDVNYGQVSSGGFPGGVSGGDWFHCNAVDYHEELDQLIVNSRNWNEFFIIDHGLTSEEAASNAGDLLYRWGNPQTYGRGTEEDRVFYQQHDAHWLLGEGPAADSISDPALTVLVYNNGNGRPSGDGSSVDELILPWDDVTDSYTLPPADDLTVPFGPDTLDWMWPELPSMDFHSHNISGSQRQPNGNTLICEGSKGHLFEITPSGEIVWEYYTAYNQFGPISQGDNPFGNATFRAYRYGPDFAGFEGRDMTPGDPVEANPYPTNCITYPAPVDTVDTSGTTSTLSLEMQILIGPNPADDVLFLNSGMDVTWMLTDASGREIIRGDSPATTHVIETANLPNGLLLLHLLKKGGAIEAPRRIRIQH